MFYIPAEVISLLTFPGIILHEMAHKFFCDLAGVKVLEVKYWSLKGGYVIHENKDVGLKHSFLISVGPFIVNSLFAMLLMAPFSFGVYLGSQGNGEGVMLFFRFMLYWAGLSLAMHAFPSDQDTSNFTEAVKNDKTKHPILLPFAKLFAGLFALLNGLRMLWIDLFYGIGLGLIVPRLF